MHLMFFHALAVNLVVLLSAVYLPRVTSFVGPKYFRGPKAVSRPDAVGYCASRASRLAVIKSNNDFLASSRACRRAGSDGCWLGLQDVYSAGSATEYMWDDKTQNTMFPGTSFVWGPSQPSDGGLIGEACVRASACPSKQTKNLALNKPATQTTTGWGGVASRGVDGNSNQNYNAGSCTATQGYVGEWWYVDLGVSTPICSVSITGRTDRVSYTQDIDIFVTDRRPDSNWDGSKYTWTPMESEKCAYVQLPVVNTRKFDCTKNVRGRFVGLKKRSANLMVLCEVQVYGTISTPKWEDVSCDAKSYPLCEQTGNVPATPSNPSSSQATAGTINGFPMKAQAPAILPNTCFKDASKIQLSRPGTIVGISVDFANGFIKSRPSKRGGNFGNGKSELIMVVIARMNAQNIAEIVFPRQGTKGWAPAGNGKNMFTLAGYTADSPTLRFEGPPLVVQGNKPLYICTQDSVNLGFDDKIPNEGNVGVVVHVYYETAAKAVVVISNKQKLAVGAVSAVIGVLALTFCVWWAARNVRRKRNALSSVDEIAVPNYGGTVDVQ